MFTKAKPPSLLDREIDRVLEQMKDLPTTTESYAELLEHLNKLHKMKTEEKASSVSKDTMLKVGANILGIVLVIGHERVHVITTQAMNMVHKPKL